MRKANATLIGAFVLGALALVVAGVLFFSRGAFREQHLRIVSFFHGSVVGLQVGAPVTFRGVPLGKVKSLGLRYNPKTGESIIQVNMELVPGTLTITGIQLRFDDQLIPALVREGLTARLVKPSFVTGLQQVELGFRPGAQASGLGDTTVAEVPTVAGEMEALTKQLEEVDIEAAVQSAVRALTSLDSILTSPELKRAIKELPEVLTSVRHTVNTIDREVAALSRAGQDGIAGSAAALQKTLAAVQTLAQNLDRESASTLSKARGTLDRASTTLDGTSALVDQRGRTMIQLQRAVDDLAATTARLRDLSERVDRDPSVLIRGR